VGLRAGLDRCGKYRPPPPGFDPRTVQPVGSRYTDYVSRPFTTPNKYGIKKERRTQSASTCCRRSADNRSEYIKALFYALVAFLKTLA
jgi:hypothetical protein